MTELVLQITFGVVIMGGLIALIMASTRIVRTPGTGWTAIWAGLGLLLAGTMLGLAQAADMLESTPVLNIPAVLDTLKDFVCLLGGSMFLGLGLIRRLVIATGGTPIEHLNETLAKTVHELGSAQELLNSIVRSAINGVMILKAIRD